MIVTPSQMKAAEESAFARGESAESLMEVAGLGIADCIRQFFPRVGTAIVFCGKGHNGGDALIAARHLLSWGWEVIIRLSSPVEDLASLTHAHLDKLPSDVIKESLPKRIMGPLILIDGLLGIGSIDVPRGTTAELINEINQLRSHQGGYSISIDLPSGLNGETGEVSTSCVQADLTITLGFVKSGLLADPATGVVGRIALVPLPGVICSDGDSGELLTTKSLRQLLPIRNFDSYKGVYGRIGILAGSKGMLGAARLASTSAVHAGGGLVTLYTLPENYSLLASLCIPEVMVKPINSYLDVLEAKHDVFAIGPGLGDLHHDVLRNVIADFPLPCVVDADALNAISSDISILKQCAGPRLLTPHPGEMERLFPQNGRTRRQWAEEFVAEYPVTLVLKGARTIIAERHHSVAYNPTGNPGMGSGGMGDVLTGVCAAMIGGGHSVVHTAMLGAWLCGRAAEIAIFNGSDSQESLSATSVIAHLGKAAESLRVGDF